jgi:hypothetical protein
MLLYIQFMPQAFGPLSAANTIEWNVRGNFYRLYLVSRTNERLQLVIVLEL